MNRNPVFDEVKGFAIWLVVLGHLVSQVGNKTVICISFFHMPVMIFISGYFFYYSMSKYNNRSDLIVHKFKSLVIPYISWSAIALLFNVGINLHAGLFSKKSFMCELVDIFFYSRSVWYLIILFLSFIIFLISEKISEIIHINFFVTLLIIWIGVSIYGPNELFAFYKFKWLFLFMIAGYECAKHNIIERIQGSIKASILGLIIFGWVVWCLYLKEYFEQYITGNYKSVESGLFGLIYYVISFYSIIIIFLFFKDNIGTKIKQYFANIGKLSMDIYVIHMFPLKLIQLIFPINMFSKLGEIESTIIIYVIMGIVDFIIIGIIKYMYNNWLEKMKVYRMIMGKF